MESKELTTRTSAPLANPTDYKSWQPPQVSGNDQLIPRIFQMQLMSAPVKNGEAKYGELRDSVSNELIGSVDKPFRIIPITMKRQWLIQRVVGDSLEFVDLVEVNQANDNWPRLSKDKEGRTLKNIRILEFFVLRPEDVAAADEAGTDPLPYLLPFRSTSLKAGKKLATQMFTINYSKKLPPPAVVMEVSAQKTKNQKGDFMILDVKGLRPSTDVEMKWATEWFNRIQSGAAKIDDRQDFDTINVEDAGDTKEF